MEPKDRQRLIRRVLVVEMALNLTVAAAKGAYGWWSGSLVIAADGVHSLVDAGANIIGLVVLHRAAAPPDREHPYGHRKFEVVAAAVLGVAIGVTAVRFAWGAFEALLQGRDAPATTALGFAIVLGTWAVNVFVAVYEARWARKLDSEYLAADAAHTASDVLVTAAVLASFTAAYFGVAWADPVGALVVLGAIGWVAWRILSANLSVLAGTAMVDPDRITKIARDVSGVLGCHRVRSHGTPSEARIDLHILLHNDISLKAAHDIAHDVEEAIKREVPEVVDVTVHMEPEESGYEGL